MHRCPACPVLAQTSQTPAPRAKPKRKPRRQQQQQQQPQQQQRQTVVHQPNAMHRPHQTGRIVPLGVLQKKTQQGSVAVAAQSVAWVRTRTLLLLALVLIDHSLQVAVPLSNLADGEGFWASTGFILALLPLFVSWMSCQTSHDVLPWPLVLPLRFLGLSTFVEALEVWKRAPRAPMSCARTFRFLVTTHGVATSTPQLLLHAYTLVVRLSPVPLGTQAHTPPPTWHYAALAVFACTASVGVSHAFRSTPTVGWNVPDSHPGAFAALQVAGALEVCTRGATWVMFALAFAWAAPAALGVDLCVKAGVVWWAVTRAATRVRRRDQALDGGAAAAVARWWWWWWWYWWWW